MNCTQIEQYLDVMMDGALSTEDLNAVEAHCRDCAACAEKLKVNRQMMRVFEEMAPEMDVPLAAQAAWRGAVKREAARKKQRHLYRYAAGIAAALVVAVGATFALKVPAKDATSVRNLSVETAGEYGVDYEESYAAAYDAAPEEASEAALIEADGAVMDMADMAMEADMGARSKAAGAPMHEVTMTVDDVERVCEYAQDLALEYEGHVDIQRFDEDGAPCANIYVDLPAKNAGEFFEAIWHFDRSGAALEPIGMGAGGDGNLSVMLVLKSK